MTTKAGIWILVAATLALAPVASLAKGPGGGGKKGGPASAQYERGQRDVDRDRLRSRDRVDQPAYQRDRLRDQDRIHAPDSARQGGAQIYGQQLMTEQERIQYREQLRLIGQDPEKRTQFMAQHRAEMQKRAQAKGVDLDKPAGNSK